MSGYKVIIDKDEFATNLDKHKLKQKKKSIENQKVKVAHSVQRLKHAAYLQIGVGVFIISLGLKNLLVDKTTHETVSLGDDKEELIVRKTETRFSKDNMMHALMVAAGLISLYQVRRRR